MKKLLVLLIVMGMGLPSYAGIKIKDLIGTWKYEAVVDTETLAGQFTFEKKEGELTGEVHTSEGDIFPMTIIKIKKDNVLYFELKDNGEVYKVTVILHKDKFIGSVSDGENEAPITGEKVK